ncbi:hypothetical protein A8C56_09630 [Niabella ginsenosidivorans]|uniref:Uncharacterized protein n=1 Tax=Niabella ginsenosidivorans TaxID=1176587 RepID=A0A1A9I0N0_9BACT|nr:hypothetical protein [Niabella ginsenosidivorans]ANH81207.1 hypothetical protein A8C56_09630 [Niabella ginsenosidivorans]
MKKAGITCWCIFLLFAAKAQIAADDYPAGIKNELQKEWPGDDELKNMRSRSGRWLQNME